MSDDNLYYTGNRNIKAISLDINTGEPLTGIAKSDRGDLTISGLNNDQIVLGLISYDL